MNVLSSRLVEDPEMSLRSCLPAIAPQIAAMRRAVYCGRGGVAFEFGGAPFLLRLPDSDVVPDEYALTLQFKVGNAAGWLFIESYDIAGEEWAGIFSRLDPRLAQALLIEEAAGLFASLTRAGGSVVRLTEVQPHFVPPVPAIRQLLEIKNTNTGITARAALCANDPEIFTWLGHEIEQLPRRPALPPASACLPIRICAGKTSLSISEVKKPQIGDVLVIRGTGRIDNLVATCIDHRGFYLPFSAELKGATVNMTFIGEKAMRQNPNEIKQPGQNIVALDDVSVPITVVIGEVELPLRAIGSLQAGYVFELPILVEDAVVHLYTGSACVGQGRLVTVGNMLGVRLLEWGGKSDGEST